MVAFVLRTSAIAVLGSSAELLFHQNVNVSSTTFASGSGEGAPNGRWAALSCGSSVLSDWLSAVPWFQLTFSARIASTHWPNVRARTATPVEMTPTCVTPGIDRTCEMLLTHLTVPLIVGGRHTIVGSAPGTWWSIVNFLRPVTASRASTRLYGLPITLKLEAGARVTPTSLVVSL